MLQVHFGEMPDAIYNTSMYFKNTYKDSWFEDELARKMLKSVDGAVVLDGGVIESRVLGKIAPTQLSGGVKTLLLVRNEPDKVFNASTCGDNCARWLLHMAKDRDITVNLHHLMDFGDRRFSIRVLNSGRVVHDMLGLIDEAADALAGDAS